MARYINNRTGNFYLFGKLIGSSLRCTILETNCCYIDWGNGANKLYDSEDTPPPLGASKGCDLVMLINGQEYIYTITGRSIELVLQPYLQQIKKQGLSLSNVTTLISAESVDGFSYLRLEQLP